MRKDFGNKPFTYPQPVYIICAKGNDGNICAMNAAWGGISDYQEIALSLSASHKTVKNILETGVYTISMATSQYVSECDYLGVVSGNNVDHKLEVCGFTVGETKNVKAPFINELPVTMECKMKSFEDGIMLGEIINVSVDESVLTDGKVDITKVHPIAFDPFNNEYVELTKVVGNAFKDGLKLK